MSYTPDRWVVVTVTDSQAGTSYDRILAGWQGGWAQSDEWKLSSSICSATSTEKVNTFECSSGSTYHCPKSCYGLTLITSATLSGWEEDIRTSGKTHLSIAINKNYEPDRTN